MKLSPSAASTFINLQTVSYTHLDVYKRQVDVSGNEFGGIEVSKGAVVETMPKLTGTAANLKNDTEEAGKPTVWIDKVSELTTAVVAVSGLNEGAAEKDQAHFYLKAPVVDTVDVSNLEELESALLNADIKEINITADITSDKTCLLYTSIPMKNWLQKSKAISPISSTSFLRDLC